MVESCLLGGISDAHGSLEVLSVGSIKATGLGGAVPLKVRKTPGPQVKDPLTPT